VSQTDRIPKNPKSVGNALRGVPLSVAFRPLGTPRRAFPTESVRIVFSPKNNLTKEFVFTGNYFTIEFVKELKTTHAVEKSHL